MGSGCGQGPRPTLVRFLTGGASATCGNVQTRVKNRLRVPPEAQVEASTGGGRSQEPQVGGVNRPSIAVHPPSTMTWLPVTKLAASEASQQTAPTISSGRAHRPRADFSA